jgi:hypothetical protein
MNPRRRRREFLATFFLVFDFIGLMRGVIIGVKLSDDVAVGPWRKKDELAIRAAD